MTLKQKILFTEKMTMQVNEPIEEPTTLHDEDLRKLYKDLTTKLQAAGLLTLFDLYKIEMMCFTGQRIKELTTLLSKAAEPKERRIIKRRIRQHTRTYKRFMNDYSFIL